MTTRPRVNVVRRDGARVSPLELFFDLVFVLAITQCTSLMASDPTWTGIGKGLVVLGLLWWSWVGYAWLTSVVDPDRGGVRVVVFAVMAALLVASLCVPDAFGDLGLTFAVAYGLVRAGHIALFLLASRDDPGLRHAVVGLGVSTAVGVAVLAAGSFLDSGLQLAVWAAALVLDMAGPLVIDTSGWRLVPAHFAERHGLIVIVALGESVVAIGVGASGAVDGSVIAAAVFGIAVVSALWWLYFDAAVEAATERLASEADVGARNALGRDAYSYLHLPAVAAVVLVALGLKTTLHDVGHALSWETGAALVGGAAVYVLAGVAFRRRALAMSSGARVVGALVLAALVPVSRQVDALVSVAGVAVVLWALIAFEAARATPSPSRSTGPAPAA